MGKCFDVPWDVVLTIAFTGKYRQFLDVRCLRCMSCVCTEWRSWVSGTASELTVDLRSELGWRLSSLTWADACAVVSHQYCVLQLHRFGSVLFPNNFIEYRASARIVSLPDRFRLWFASNGSIAPRFFLITNGIVESVVDRECSLPTWTDSMFWYAGQQEIGVICLEFHEDGNEQLWVNFLIFMYADEREYQAFVLCSLTMIRFLFTGALQKGQLEMHFVRMKSVRTLVFVQTLVDAIIGCERHAGMRCRVVFEITETGLDGFLGSGLESNIVSLGDSESECDRREVFELCVWLLARGFARVSVRLYVYSQDAIRGQLFLVDERIEMTDPALF